MPHMLVIVLLPTTAGFNILKGYALCMMIRQMRNCEDNCECDKSVWDTHLVYCIDYYGIFTSMIHNIHISLIG